MKPTEGKDINREKWFGLISKYLATKDDSAEVTLADIWMDALGNHIRDAEIRHSRPMVEIVERLGWTHHSRPLTSDHYLPTSYWAKGDSADAGEMTPVELDLVKAHAILAEHGLLHLLNEGEQK